MEIVRQKNVATRIVFPIVDADGDLVTGATGLDSEIDEFADGSNPTGFADCTNEATEIGSTGIYYLNLTQTEMNQDYLVVQVKTTSSGAKTQVILIRTIVGDPLNLATTDDGGTINVAAGVVEAQVKSIDNNAITAASIATDAITNAKIAAGAIGASEIADGAIDAGAIASGAITSAKFAASAIDATAIASNAITSAKIATGAITNATFAAGAIDAAAIAADAIGSSELAASAVTEIQSGLSTLDAAGVRSAVGLASANLDTQLSTIDDFLDTEVAAIKAKTDQLTFTTSNRVDSTVVDKTGFSLSSAGIQAVWDALTSALTTVGSIGKLLVDNINATISSRASQTSLDTLDDYVDTEVAAIKAKTDQLTFGTANRVDAQVYGMENNVVTANAIAADAIGSSELAASAVSEIADQVWEEAIADHSGTAGSTAASLAGATAPSAAAVADAVWEEALADHSGTVGSTAEALDASGGGATPSAIADAVWDELQSGHTTSGSFGAYLDANVSHAGAVAIQNPSGGRGGITAKQAEDIAKRTWETKMENGKTAKEVLLEAAMPEAEKPGYDDSALKATLEQIATILGGISEKDSTTPVLDAIGSLEKPKDYAQNFAAMGARFDEVVTTLGTLLPNLTEFADRVAKVDSDMSAANSAIQETLDKIHGLDGDFAELQGLVDAFKDKLEEQVDMDKRMAALGGKLNEKALADIGDKIAHVQRTLLQKIENVKFDILKNL